MRALVLVGVGGVQRSLVESRLSSDLRNASQVVVGLSSHLVSVLGGEGEVVLPVPGGLSNKVVAVVDGDAVPGLAERVRQAVSAWWAGQVERLYPGGVDVDAVGCPEVLVRAVVHRDGEDEQSWWRRATAEFAAAKRAKPVPAGVSWAGREVCRLSPRLPVADPAPTRPGIRGHEMDRLSQAGWVRRLWHRVHDLQGFPSTRAVAAAPFVAEYAGRLDRAAVSDLARVVRRVWPVNERPVPGLDGDAARVAGWLGESAWEPVALARRCGISRPEAESAARQGLAGVRRLRASLGLDAAGPGAYVALIAQDVDGLGRRLAAAPFRDGLRRMGATLAELGAGQARLCAARHGCVVYAGGDDLLVLAPARGALELARELHDDAARRLVGPDWGGRATVSTGVVFFHVSFPLSLAVARTREALHAAKHIDGGGKHGLSVVVLRRGGERASSVQPWRAPEPGPEWADFDPVAELLAVVAARPAGALAHEVERDRAVLADLVTHGGVPGRRAVQEELARLVHRHSQAGADVGRAVYRLARQERVEPGPALQPVPSLLVARYLNSPAVTGSWAA